ncbi:MAG: hypothetical protein ACI8W7_002852, partial [Gammaproteobacteria bacterium]
GFQYQTFVPVILKTFLYRRSGYPFKQCQFIEKSSPPF